METDSEEDIDNEEAITIPKEIYGVKIHKYTGILCQEKFPSRD